MGVEFWVGFHLFVLAMIYLDLKVFHRNVKEVTFKQTSLCCLFWVALALAFNAFIFWLEGGHAGITFFTAYVLEASLSIDNLFVFLSIFSFFHVEPAYQHRVLFLGILGALICRIVFVLLGLALLKMFSWMYFVFGGILCLSALCLYQQKEERELKNSCLLRFCKKTLPVYEGFHEGHFWVRKRGKFYFTTLFIALLFVEASDILFAVDSVPAVLSITTDVFLAYTSNVFAILGLRSFYFYLAALHKKFSYLKSAIILILLFIGIKMLIYRVYVFPVLLSLAVIAIILTTAIILSKNERRAR